ncbi:MAG: hypothetical protein GXP42_04095 [Chloroflexi bacterium]|nr:hypothetical protein [Chloroflexota bacterium]
MSTDTSHNSPEPLGGEPPAGVGSSSADYDYELKYRRAFELAARARRAIPTSAA